jgi:NADH dehydrogenase
MDKKSVVVLGAGFGGLRAAMDVATGLKQMSLLDKYEVVLIDRNDCHLFIPLLYKVAARPEPEHESNCSYDIKDLLKGMPITFMQGEIISPDVANGTIALKDGRTVRADYLVIALGSETNYFGIPGLKEHALQLKTLETALEVRKALAAAFARGGNIKVIAGGGGPNGIELAAEMRLWANEEEKKNPNLFVSVSIVEAMPGILTGFDPKIIAIAMKRLAAIKVSVLTNMKISSVSEDAIAIGDAASGVGVPIPFDIFVWTGGTKTPDLLATVPLAKEKRGKPMAETDMACLPATSDLKLAPMVYAVGDNVCYIDPKTQKPVPPVAHAALSEGAIAAHNLLEEIKKAESPSYAPHLKPFAPDSLTYAYVIPIGENWAVSKTGSFILTGWFGWEMGRIVELYYLKSIMSLGRALKAWQRM